MTLCRAASSSCLILLANFSCSISGNVLLTNSIDYCLMKRPRFPFIFSQSTLIISHSACFSHILCGPLEISGQLRRKYALNEFNVRHSMNGAEGRQYDNARCESIRGQVTRMKEEWFYSRSSRSTDYTTKQLKTMIWRYYMSYWNNRRIC